MAKRFNTTGSCNPDRHYMVNIDDKLAKIEVHLWSPKLGIFMKD